MRIRIGDQDGGGIAHRRQGFDADGNGALDRDVQRVTARIFRRLHERLRVAGQRLGHAVGLLCLDVERPGIGGRSLYDLWHWTSGQQQECRKQAHAPDDGARSGTKHGHASANCIG